MSVQSFRRVEKKYLLTEKQYKKLIVALKGKIKENNYSHSTISNIYFDTYDFALVRNSIEKPIYKEKVRIRSYKVPNLDDEIFIEIKKKYRGIVGKRRIKLKLEEFYDYLENKNNTEIDNLTMKEIDYLFKKYNLIPAMYVGYERDSYETMDNTEFRITFDKNLRYREDNLKLEFGNCGKKFFDENMYIMEVKTLDAMPVWFCNILSTLKIYPSSFSKYGEIYKKVIRKEEKGKDLCLKVF